MFKGIFISNSYIKDKNLNSNERIILGFLELFNKYIDDKRLTNKTISSCTGISESIVNKSLKRLEAEGYIKIKFIYHKKTMIKLGKEITILK
nr:MAG TPA: Z DNA-binding protein [Caudoviricetes sp.]